MNYKTYKVKVYTTGHKEWWLNDQLHREDGPAVELASGSKEWYLNGQRHREDGPAIEGVNGDKFWLLNGQYHREDGPACEYAGGTKQWHLSGEYLTKQQFNEQMNPKKDPCEDKVVEIDGKKYKLTKV